MKAHRGNNLEEKQEIFLFFPPVMRVFAISSVFHLVYKKNLFIIFKKINKKTGKCDLKDRVTLHGIVLVARVHVRS